MDSSLDLSKVRHDLRTPIHHIVGYCEMLMEEENLPDRLREDLAKILAGGRRLLELIGHYFNEATFGTKLDLQQLQHELRTPVNHIIGYTELLQEVAEETGSKHLIPDLQRIHEGAIQWLALMEEHLIPASARFDPDNDATVAEAPAQVFVSPGITFQTLRPKSAETSPHWNAHLLIVDDDPANRELLGRRLQRYGAKATLAKSGLEALQLLRQGGFDLVLLDLLMPGLDGYQVLVKLKADPKLRHIPVVMVSGLDQANGIARCLEVGAEDYLTKPFNPVMLRARIGACLEKKHWRDQEQATYQALLKSQQHLAKELAEAGAYVRSQLPLPIKGGVSAAWCFQPSAQLGGDIFGYHWIDDDRVVFYLLDVCGHGVGAALLSVAVANVIRNHALPAVDFASPAAVLTALNRLFAMEQHNQMYFTAWYGIYDRVRSELTYASGGHPPALLLRRTANAEVNAIELRTPSPAVGCLDDVKYSEANHPLQPGDHLLILSDGVYEIVKPDGTMMQWPDLRNHLKQTAVANGFHPDQVLAFVREQHGSGVLEDDFSLLHVTFR